MPVVDRQKERQIVERARQRGWSDDQIKQAVLKFRADTTGTSPTTTPEAATTPQKPNLLQSIAKPFIKTASSGLGFLEGVGRLATGDVRGANEATTKERNFGFLGSARPVGVTDQGKFGNTGQFAKDVIGTGLEIGSYAAPTGAVAGLGLKGATQGAKQVIGRGVLPALKSGAKFGALAGSTGSFGAALQDPNATVGSVAGQTALGTLAGGTIGAAVPGLGALGLKGGRAAVGAGRSAVNALKPITTPAVGAVKEGGSRIFSSLGRGLKKTLKAGSSLADINKKPIRVRNLYRSGVSEEAISLLGKADSQTKKIYRKAVDLLASKKDQFEVVGNQLTKAATRLAGQLKNTGKKIGALRGRLRGKVIEMDKVQNQLFQEANNLRLTVKNGRLVAPPDVPVDDDVLEVLNDIYKYAGSGTDAEKADLLRQFLAKSFSKKGTPFQGNAERLLAKYRELLLEAIEAADSEYGQILRQYADQIKPLQAFAKLIGYTGDIEKLATSLPSLSAGRKARSILGRGSTRPQEVIENLIATAKKYGIKLDTDFMELLRFADMLDDEIGLAQTTGFQGSIQRAGEAAIERTSTGSLAVDALKAVGRLGAPGSDEKLKAIRGFLGGLPGIPKGNALAPVMKLNRTNTETSGVRAALTVLKGGKLATKKISKLTGKERKYFPNLSQNGRAKEAAAFEKLDRETNAIIKQHAQLPEAHGGKLINPDDIRPLVHDEKKFGAYRGTEAQTVHEPSSELANYLKDKKLAEVKPGDLVIYTSGGPGSGKGTALDTVMPGWSDEMMFGYDSVLGNPTKAITDINEVLARGGRFRLPHVVRDIEDAWVNGVIKRAKSKGRTVPLGVFLDGTEEANKAMKEVLRKFMDNESVTMPIIDNRTLGGPAKLISLQDFEAIDRSNLRAKFMERLRQRTLKEYNGGKGFSKEVLAGLLGE